MSESVTTNLCPSAPGWERTCALPEPGDLDLAADIVRLIDSRPGLDSEEIARSLGIGDWDSFRVTAALCEAGILGVARE